MGQKVYREKTLSQLLLDACTMVGDHRVVTGLHLLDSMQVAHGNCVVRLHVPGINLQSVTGVRRRPLASQRAYRSAGRLRQARRGVHRHLVVSQDRSHQQVHMREAPPAASRPACGNSSPRSPAWMRMSKTMPPQRAVLRGHLTTGTLPDIVTTQNASTIWWMMHRPPRGHISMEAYDAETT